MADKTDGRCNDSVPYLDSPFVALRSASRAVTQLYDLVLSPMGIKASQFDTLRTVAAFGTVKQCELARAYARSPETLSRSLASLRAKGLVEVRIDRANREQAYAITAAGREVLAQATPSWLHAEARLQESLGDLESILLSRIANRAVEAARAAEHLRIVRRRVTSSTPRAGATSAKRRMRDPGTGPPPLQS
ncbi:MAG: MarR family winged helix-turn-helix transcriptional regulator [Terriglobales bacterium]